MLRSTMIDRRHIIFGAAALAAVGPFRSLAAVARREEPPVLLTGARILTMDDLIGDLPRGDILVKEGRIAAIGPSLPRGGAQEIDMGGRILLPGLIDTHWHMWNTIAAGEAGIGQGGFLKHQLATADRWTPGANALGVRLAIAQALDGGITTVHNWAHNIRSPGHARAELAAMRTSGIRGRFGYGYPQTLAPDRLMDIADLRAIRSREFGHGDDLLDLGIVVRGPERSSEAVWRHEFETAREMELPISSHIATTEQAQATRGIARLDRAGFLGRNLLLVHATHAAASDFSRLAATETSLSLSPWTELEVGYGLPAVRAALSAHVATSLSVDTMTLAGRADLFGVMRLVGDLADGLSQAQGQVPGRQRLALATVAGARALGLFDKVGSLSVGKRADIIAVRADRLGTDPAADPYAVLTHMAQPADVDLVMLDGRIRKLDGQLTDIDLTSLLMEAREMMHTLSP